MRSLTVPKTSAEDSLPLGEVSRLLDSVGAHCSMEERPWPQFPYRPQVEIAVAHTGSALWIRFNVLERAVLAEKSRTNEKVSEDSCVELFLSPPPGKRYYNFEWNCIGTCLAGVGVDRRGRRLLDPALIETIRRSSTLGNRPFGERACETAWSLVAVVPASIFVEHAIPTLSGIEMTGNLYKCGESLSVPHYLAWNRIDTPTPDYHRPEQFGRLIFER